MRALVADEEWNALLVHLSFPRWSGWVLPGGGIDEGESDEAALERELAEELGLVDVGFAGPIWERTVRWEGAGDFAGQTERIYLVRCARFEPQPHFSPEVLAAEGVTAMRWWSLDELAACDEVVAPGRLAELVRELRDHGSPPSVIDVGE